MIKFNPENKSVLTYGEALGPAMDIKDQSEAQEYLKGYIAFIMSQEPNMDEQKAESVAKQNLGYYAGYYGEETRRRVEKLFLCEHPILGSIKQNGTPTSEEALKCGTDGKTLSQIR